ncbi:structural cement protein Gp24 [Oceaniglobus ichthyenteri]|uniref:structural cement protein Gp24 n=1 Tax=Oceaniglobus ichthyenteri TaxID=2136177 RepID=UPI000D3B0B46|nr:DUF2190 family protein [Oceaniglobus ichthyenteri]
MAVQSTYAETMPVALNGMIANTEPNVLISREVQTAAIGFGKVVKQGTADKQVQAATAANDVVRGITVRDQSATGDEFAVADSALVMTKGVIWVTAFDTVVAGAPVYMRVAGGAGKFTDTTTDNLAIPGAIFETSGAADELVAIRLG